MLYPRYFHPGQKLRLQRKDAAPTGDRRLDSLSGTLVECTGELFAVRLPYANPEQEGYPFFPGMPFDILGDFFGFGMRLSATFESLHGAGTIRLRPCGDLEFFFRRRHLRVEVALWFGCRRGPGALRTLRRRWKQHAEQLGGGIKPEDLPPFQRQTVTLGGGGLRLQLPAPVAENELLLLYLALDDRGPLVCALAEPAWTDRPDERGMQTVGVRFLNLLESDQRRIEFLVRRLRRELQERGEGEG